MEIAQRGFAALRDLIAGTPLARPAKHVGAYVEWLLAPAQIKQNRHDDDALRALIRTLPVDANCVDVGANVGDILTAMVEACPRGRHIAFEPVPALCDELTRRFPTVDVRRQGLSDAAGQASFTVVPSLPSRSGISSTLDLTIDADVHEITIDVITLDEALPASYRPELVKVDVEGGELEVLLGAQRVLRECRPLLALEHQYGKRQDPGKTTQIWNLFDDYAYTVQPIRGRVLDRTQFLAAVESGHDWNFLARPR